MQFISKKEKRTNNEKKNYHIKYTWINVLQSWHGLLKKYTKRTEHFPPPRNIIFTIEQFASFPAKGPTFTSHSGALLYLPCTLYTFRYLTRHDHDHPVCAAGGCEQWLVHIGAVILHTGVVIYVRGRDDCQIRR